MFCNRYLTDFLRLLWIVVTHCTIWTDYPLMWCLSTTHHVSHHLCIVFNSTLTWHRRVNIFFCKCIMLPSNDLVSIYNSTIATHSETEKIALKMAPLADFNNTFIGQTTYLSKKRYMYVLILSVPPGPHAHIQDITYYLEFQKSVVCCDICWLW
jgi:hypothetical protein